MQRSGYGPSVGWGFTSIPFHMPPGVGWRLYMSRIASEILPVHARHADGLVKPVEVIV